LRFIVARGSGEGSFARFEFHEVRFLELAYLNKPTVLHKVKWGRKRSQSRSVFIEAAGGR